MMLLSACTEGEREREREKEIEREHHTVMLLSAPTQRVRESV